MLLLAQSEVLSFQLGRQVEVYLLLQLPIERLSFADILRLRFGSSGKPGPCADLENRVVLLVSNCTDLPVDSLVLRGSSMRGVVLRRIDRFRLLHARALFLSVAEADLSL